VPPLTVVTKSGQTLGEFISLKNQGKFTGNGLDLDQFKSYSPIMLTHKISPRKRQRILEAKNQPQTKASGQTSAPKILGSMLSPPPLNGEQKRQSYNGPEKNWVQIREKRLKAISQSKQHGPPKKKGQGRINKLYQDGTAKLRKVNLYDYEKKEEDKKHALASPRPMRASSTIVKDQQIS
jgi:hypothetical protein